MIKWGEKTTCKFVERYIYHECLWNYKNPAYRIKRARNDAVNDIAAFMDINHFGEKEVRKKIRILRSTFSQELKKYKEDPTFSSNLKWFNMLDLALKSTNITLHMPTDHDDAELLNDTVMNEGSIDSAPTLIKPFNFRYYKSRIPNKKINSKVPKKVSTDPYDSFGKYVANELRKYDTDLLPHVKKAITDIIFSADIGQLRTNRKLVNNIDSASHTEQNIPSPTEGPRSPGLFADPLNTNISLKQELRTDN